MTLDLPDGPAQLARPALVRDAFADAGYTVDALRDVLHLSGELSGGRSDLHVYRRRLARSPSALAELVSLFALGLPLGRARAREALGEDAVAELVESGTLRPAGDDVVASVRIMPHGDLWVASDRWTHDAYDDDPLHVTGINAPASLLARLTPRRRVGAVLDLGTGNGIQALLAAAHADRVVATDVNPRALAFTRFNAGLNGIDNVELRLGSMFEPVAGERFDLVVSNPPYVISPESDVVYRDSGDQPGAMCRQIVSAIPGHLNDGGFATVLVSWPVRAGTDWTVELGSWMSPGADAWLLKLGSDDPLTHAATWHTPQAAGDPDGFAAAVDSWVAYYDTEGIEQIDFGAVILHGNPGSCRVVRTDHAVSVVSSASEQIIRVFDAAQAADPLDTRWRLAPGHVFQQRLASEGGEWRLVHATLGLDAGVDLPVSLDTVMVQVVLGLDGTRTGLEAVSDAAERSGLDEPERLRLEELSATMLDELHRRGVILPA